MEEGGLLLRGVVGYFSSISTSIASLARGKGISRGDGLRVGTSDAM
jgi:hypothetical protein